MCFDRNPFTCSCKVGTQKINGFKFGTFIGRFPSDSMASMAVKELNTPCNIQHFSASWGDGEGEAAASEVFSVPQNPHAQLLFSHRQGQGYRWEKGLVVSACLLLQRPFRIATTQASGHLCCIFCVGICLFVLLSSVNSKEPQDVSPPETVVLPCFPFCAAVSSSVSSLCLLPIWSYM